MFSVAQHWNPKQQTLKTLLATPNSFPEAIALCKNMHNQLHDIGSNGVYHELITGLSEHDFRSRVEGFSASIAWNIWHITRIEDAVGAILLADRAQVFDASWQHKLHINISATGNGFRDDDMAQLNTTINIPTLLAYRAAVGRSTQQILSTLDPNDKNRKPRQQQLDRLLTEAVLTSDEDSIWLLDFWAKKTVAGLLSMPITRHQIVHLNECLKIKAKLGKRKS